MKENIKETAFALAKEPEIARNTEAIKWITSEMAIQEAADAIAQMLDANPLVGDKI